MDREQIETGNASLNAGERRTRGIDTNRGTYAALFAIVTTALALRLYHIDRESAWGDEALTLLHLPAPDLLTFLREAFERDPIASISPLLHFTEYVWFYMFGSELLAMRAMFVCTGVASVALLYGVGSALFGRRAGLIAAFLLTLSLVHVYYSQEVRFYAWLGFWALASTYALLCALDRGSKGWWAVHGLCNFALIGTHIFAPLFFAVEGVFLLVHFRGRIRPLAIWTGFHCMILMCVAVWIWLLPFASGEAAPYFREDPPGLQDIAATAVIFAGGRVAEEDPRPYLPGGISLDLLITAVTYTLVAWGVVATWRAPNTERKRVESSLVFVLTWAVLPLLLLFVLSHVWQMVFFYRYVLYSLFAVNLMAGLGIARIPWAPARHLVLITLGAALLYQNLGLERPIRPDHRGAADTIAAQGVPPIRVMALKQFNALGMEYALRSMDFAWVWHHGYPELCQDVFDTAERGEEAWVIFHRWADRENFEGQLEQGRRDWEGRFTWERFEWGGLPPLIGYRVSIDRENPNG